jgi:hypothetical protein
MSSVPEIKKALLAAGFEVYRTRADEVHIADRVRDNLIMDSGVSVRCGDSLLVKFVVRAQRSDFPADGAPTLFDRARALAAGAQVRGYQETGALTSPMLDPADPGRTLDTFYEVSFEKAVANVTEAMAEVGFALAVEKAARTHPPPV